MLNTLFINSAHESRGSQASACEGFAAELELGLENGAFTTLNFQRLLEQLDATSGTVDEELDTQWVQATDLDARSAEGESA